MNPVLYEARTTPTAHPKLYSVVIRTPRFDNFDEAGQAKDHDGYDYQFFIGYDSDLKRSPKFSGVFYKTVQPVMFETFEWAERQITDLRTWYAQNKVPVPGILRVGCPS